LTEGSVAALATAATDLAACPDAYIYVEGHTDSDGDDNRNLALSVARSEAVIAALVADGANADRLYAVGYGESAPIADNKTNAGKKANRRIVFTVLDKPL
jgi:outer membrane protein OmpA-like peptidoglycan-associated protein